MLITNLDEIIETIEASEGVFLYDSSAVSKHELAFYREGVLLAKHFVEDAPLVITNTIYDELKIAVEGDHRYLNYFKQFNKVLLISEENFVTCFHYMYSPKKRSLAKYRISALAAFKTIQPLAEIIKNLNLEEDPGTIIKSFNSAFSSGKNKGEYSLLWLSKVLREVFPALSISFIGTDRDLFRIVDHTYYRFEDIHTELSHNTGKIQILSTDSMLQALARQQKGIDALCGICRDELRKVLFRQINSGITNHTLSNKSIDNRTFKEKISQSLIDIIY